MHLWASPWHRPAWTAHLEAPQERVGGQNGYAEVGSHSSPVKTLVSSEELALTIGFDCVICDGVLLRLSWRTSRRLASGDLGLRHVSFVHKAGRVAWPTRGESTVLVGMTNKNGICIGM